MMPSNWQPAQPRLPTSAWNTGEDRMGSAWLACSLRARQPRTGSVAGSSCAGDGRSIVQERETSLR